MSLVLCAFVVAFAVLLALAAVLIPVLLSVTVIQKGGSGWWLLFGLFCGLFLGSIVLGLFFGSIPKLECA